MALVTTTPNSTASLRAQSFGDNVTKVIMDWTALSGDTSGTVTVAPLRLVKHVLMLGGRLTHTAAPTYSENVATLAFTVPTETAASKLTQGITLTATANQGAGGNSITIAFTSGGTAGAEVVTVTGLAISVQIQSGTSTITQVRTAINASTAAAALVTATGTSASTVSTAGATPLLGGVTGGAKGTLIAIGI